MADPKNEVKKGEEPAKKSEEKVRDPLVNHVKMRRKHPQHPGGPLTATVHPAEVRNFQEAGWYEEA